MKTVLRTTQAWLVMLGLDPLKTLRALRGVPAYLRDLQRLRSASKESASPFPLGRIYPCLSDRYEASGSASGHYFHQDLLVARRIHARQPEVHFDVGSRIDGFVAHVASFRPIQVIDLRPMPTKIPNVHFRIADLMKELPDSLIECCDSLSSLHAVEHFGLGRYGDVVRIDGHLTGLANMHRMLKPGGQFYFSVPIGPQRIEFNAHRVFSLRYLMDYFVGKYRVDGFSFVDDQGELHEDRPLDDLHVANNHGCDYGCGIFELTKL